MQIPDKQVIRRNKLVFDNYCRLRRQNAYDLNARKAAVAFDVIPVLLSLNDHELPGYVV